MLSQIGLAPEDFAGTIDAFEGRLHPDDNQRVSKQLEHSLDTGEPYRVEQRIRNEDGNWVWFDVRGQVVRTQDQKRIVGIGFNITEKKKREAQLRERVKELDALHQTTELFATRKHSTESLLEELATEIPNWFQYPEKTDVKITVDEIEIISDEFDSEQRGISTAVTNDHGSTLRIDVSLREDSQGARQLSFFAEEEQLLDTVTTKLSTALDRAHR